MAIARYMGDRGPSENVSDFNICCHNVICMKNSCIESSQTHQPKGKKYVSEDVQINY